VRSSSGAWRLAGAPVSGLCLQLGGELHGSRSRNASSKRFQSSSSTRSASLVILQ
jgi:hypothetical protein